MFFPNENEGGFSWINLALYVAASLNEGASPKGNASLNEAR